MIAVAAYGQLLPEEILEIPEYGCMNVHGSLLPRIRGAAPIQRAIIEGDEETGITIMYMEKGIDTGDMLAKAATTQRARPDWSFTMSLQLWVRSCWWIRFRSLGELVQG